MQNKKFKTQNSKLKTQKGFTLIEVVIVIVILSVVSAVGLHFLASSVRVYAMSINQKTLLDEGKLALERMCRDIRDARSLTSPVAGGSGSLISFTRTNATVQDSANENITFRQTGNTLEKVKTSPAVVSSLAGNVSAFTVTRGTLEDEIKLVLTLSLGTGENVTLQTKVYPKNLSDNASTKNLFSKMEGGDQPLKISISSNSRGVSVLFLLVAMLLMVTMGYVLTYLLPSKQKSVIFPIYSNQALFIAQSGVEYAVRYSSNQGWRTTATLVGLNNPPVNQRSLGNGRFTISYDNIADTLTSTGEITGASQRRIVRVADLTQFLNVLILDPASPVPCRNPPVPPPTPPAIARRARFYIKYVGTNSVTMNAFSASWIANGANRRLTDIYMFVGGAWVQKYSGTYTSGSGSVNFNLGGSSQTITPNQVIPVLTFWNFNLNSANARNILFTFLSPLGDPYVFNLDPEGDELPAC